MHIHLLIVYNVLAVCWFIYLFICTNSKRLPRDRLSVVVLKETGRGCSEKLCGRWAVRPLGCMYCGRPLHFCPSAYLVDSVLQFRLHGLAWSATTTPSKRAQDAGYRVQGSAQSRARRCTAHAAQLQAGWAQDVSQPPRQAPAHKYI